MIACVDAPATTPVATTAPAETATKPFMAPRIVAPEEPPPVDKQCDELRTQLDHRPMIPGRCVAWLAKTPDAAKAKRLWLDLRGEMPEGITGLSAFVALEELDVTWTDGAPAGLLATLHEMPKLTSLRVRGEIALADLAAALPDLRSLDMYGGDPKELARFPHLEGATLACPAPGEQIVSPSLRALSLSCHDVESPSLEGIAGLTDLEELDISDSRFKSLAPIAKLVKLTRLDAHATAIKTLAPLLGMKQLAWLDVRDTAIASVAGLGALPALKFLDLGNDGVGSVAPLASSRSIESLWLPGSKVADVSVLAKIPSLKELMLPRRCTETGAQALHRLRPDVHVLAWTDQGGADPSCF